MARGRKIIIRDVKLRINQEQIIFWHRFGVLVTFRFGVRQTEASILHSFEDDPIQHHMLLLPYPLYFFVGKSSLGVAYSSNLHVFIPLCDL